MRRALLLAVVPACSATATSGTIGPANTPPPVCAGPSGPVDVIPLDRPDHPGRIDAIDGKPVWLGADDLLALVRQDDAVQYAVVADRDCATGTVDCRAAVVRIADNVITDRLPIPASETIARVPAPFAVEWMALEDHDGDGTEELWIDYAITSVPPGDDGTWRMTFYAIFGTAPFDGRFYGEHTAVPTSPTGWACHPDGGALRAVDADCDGTPDLLLDQACAMVQCKADPRPELAGCSHGVAYHVVNHHLPNGSYRGEVTSEQR